MTTILIVDDEAKIRTLVTAYLEAEGFTVYSADDGQGALLMFRRYRPALIVLDIMLPEIDGLDVLRHIRRESEAYVLLLTAKSDEVDRVIGLSIGADDYLTKPFSPRELVARVKAILRRGRDPNAVHNLLSFDTLHIDEGRREVQVEGEKIDLTAIEFNLLYTLATHAGRVLTREQLIEKVWGYDFYGDTRVVDVHIGRLRGKLEADPAEPRFVQTVRGVGYKLQKPS